MCELLVFEGTLHRLRGCIDDFEASDVPRVEGEHGTAKAPGDRDLAQGAPSGADRDHGVRRGDDHGVARLAQTGRERDRQMGVRTAAVGVGQDADHRTALARRAFARRAHHTAKSSVDHDRALPGEKPADLARRNQLRWGRLRGAAHRDIPPMHRPKSLFGTLRREVQRPWGKEVRRSLDKPNRRSEEHTSELQSRLHLVCRLLLEKKKKNNTMYSVTIRISTYPPQIALPLPNPLVRHYRAQAVPPLRRPSLRPHSVIPLSARTSHA